MHSEDKKIHLSDSVAFLLSKFLFFVQEERGLIEVKGKGVMRTFYLQWNEQYRYGYFDG